MSRICKCGEDGSASKEMDAENHSRNVILPSVHLERFAALPPRDHTPRRHLGLALDEDVSPHFDKRLTLQLIVRKIRGNS